MFRVVGADQRVYGPVTSDQMRQWIAEGRANAATRVQAEGTFEWKPLSAIPEFASALAATRASLPGNAGRDTALQGVKGPALALKVTAGIYAALAVIDAVMQLTGLHFNLFGHEKALKAAEAVSDRLGILEPIVNLVIAAIVWRGASLMQRLEGRAFALTAAILVMLPCVTPCCLIGVAFGIWALVVLNKPEIKSQFT